MKKAVSTILPIPFKRRFFLLLISFAAAIFLLQTSCSNSRNATMASLTPPVMSGAMAPTPHAKSDASQFSRNFFSAFPLVRVEITSQTGKEEILEFLFDTGNAGLSIVDANAAQRLGLELTPAGNITFAGVSLPALRARAVKTQLFNHEKAEKRLLLRDVSFQVIDLTPFAELAGRRVDGILGRDIISRFVTTVDYEQQTVVFGNPTVSRSNAESATSSAVSKAVAPGSSSQQTKVIVPFELRNGWIVVGTRINDAFEEEMILDTGASITTFSEDKIRQLNFDISQARPTTLMLPIGRLTFMPNRLREIEFGGLKLNDAASVVVSSREGLFTAGTGMSLLGANLLRHFRLTIDYGRRQLTLERNTEFEPDPNEYTSIGVMPLLRDGRFYVSGVVNGSPADQEGVQTGDEIIRLAGKTMGEYSFGELIEALRGPADSRLDIIVRRGQRTIELQLKRVSLL